MTKNTKTTTTRTRRQVVTHRDLQKAIRKASLTREEELVIRMRLGISETGIAKLSFRGQNHDELATKLAQIEAEALAHLRPRPVAHAPEEGQALKAAIIEKLKRV